MRKIFAFYWGQDVINSRYLSSNELSRIAGLGTGKRKQRIQTYTCTHVVRTKPDSFFLHELKALLSIVTIQVEFMFIHWERNVHVTTNSIIFISLYKSYINYTKSTDATDQVYGV